MKVPCKHPCVEPRWHPDAVRSIPSIGHFVYIETWNCVSCGMLHGMGPAALADRAEYLAACFEQDRNAGEATPGVWCLSNLVDTDTIFVIRDANQIVCCIDEHDDLEEPGPPTVAVAHVVDVESNAAAHRWRCSCDAAGTWRPGPRGLGQVRNGGGVHVAAMKRSGR